MYEITYCSRAISDLGAEDISAILEKAQDYNSKNTITGCLLYHNQEFIQILEGEKETLQQLYSKICQDNRHTDIVLLSEGTKEERVFSNWSMAFYVLSPDDIEDLGKEVFKDNLITFSNLVKKSTFPTFVFWTKARQLLEK